jgi:hypothetical protein
VLCAGFGSVTVIAHRPSLRQHMICRKRGVERGQDKERVASARFSLDHAKPVPLDVCESCLLEVLLLNVPQEGCAKADQARPPAARARQGARRQSSRTHAVIPAGSIDSPSRAGFAFPVGQSSSRFRRALSRCAATRSAETLRPLFRATDPGTIPVPHRRPSAGVASGRGFLPTVLRYPESRLPVARMVATIELKLPDLVASAS